MERLLVLCRHGQSDWNSKNLFTGWKDPDLTPLGANEARIAGIRLKTEGVQFDRVFTSKLIRAQKTGRIILETLGQSHLPMEETPALNERDYGALSGLNKDEARKKWGNEQVELWRRSYSTAPPEGESLRDTVARVLPYYIYFILPSVLSGKRTLIAAHGNSLRALIMALEGHTPESISALELQTGVPILYRFKDDSTLLEKKKLEIG